MRPRWFHESRADRVFATRYPFGIAQRSVGRAVVTQTALKSSDLVQSSQSESGPVLFVIPYSDNETIGVSDSFSGAQGELLAKAITQGLKWKLTSARIFYVHQNSNGLNSASKHENQFSDTQGMLQKTIDELRPVAIVALGAEALRALGLAVVDNVRAPVGSRWVEHIHCPALSTHDLREVLKNSDTKKAFWQDLKFLGEKIPL